MTKDTEAQASCCSATRQAESRRARLPPDEEVRRQAEVLKALSDPARIRIVCALRGEELCVCELMEIMDLPQTVVSHHLKVLKYAGIIKDRREGKWINYSLTDCCATRLLEVFGKREEGGISR